MTLHLADEMSANYQSVTSMMAAQLVLV